MGIIGMLLGFFVWFYIEDYFNAKKGNPKPFSKNSLVIIDKNGLQIEGLGLAKWPEVLSLEGVPDAEYLLIVYTTPFGKLMLHHDINKLAPIINGYLNSQHETSLQAAQSSDHSVFSFKAVIFRWPIFLTWILAGYLFATFVAFVLMFASEKGFFATTLALIVVVPISAYLVWSIPFWQVSLLVGKRTKVFDLSQDKLTSKDSTIDIDLHSAKVSFNHKSGIGYVLYFMSIKPQTGRQIDLLVAQDEWFVLQKKVTDNNHDSSNANFEDKSHECDKFQWLRWRAKFTD